MSNLLFDSDQEELILDFIRSFSMPARGYFKNKAVIAVMIWFYEKEGRAPLNTDYIPQEIWETMSKQFGAPLPNGLSFNWEGRTAKRFRQKIRIFLGYRLPSPADKDLLHKWLFHKISSEGKSVAQLQTLIYSYFKAKKLEPYSQKELYKFIRSVNHQFEQNVCVKVSSKLSIQNKKYLDKLIISGGQTKEDEETAEFKHLKNNPNGKSKKDIQLEIKKLQTLRSITLPKDLFEGVPDKLVKTYANRIKSELPSHIRSRKPSARHSMMAAFCQQQLKKTTDSLVEQFRSVLNRVRLRAESTVKQQILESVTRVDGKFDMLYSLAKVTFNSPKDIVEDVVYPTVSKEKLKDIMVDLDHRGKWYSHQVGQQMCSSYSTGCRAQILSLLNVLELKAQNPSQTNILRAVQLIKRYAISSKKLIPLEEDVPLEGVVDSKWLSLIYDKESGQIRRMHYEVAVFEELRSRLTYKDIWVVGSSRYDNPDLDTPQDFYDNKASYFKELNLPDNAEEFVERLQAEMTDKLEILNTTLPTNKKVKMLSKKNGWIHLSPSAPQEEPLKLTSLQSSIYRRWKSISLLDLLKEVEMRTNFIELFTTASSFVKIEPETLKKRLLLCLCSLGNNTGLKRMSAANGEETYSDLRYVKRRFISAENIRSAIVTVINKTREIRNPSLWGEASTGCACDSTQVSAWDQNLMTQWHARYKSSGVMIYWHVDQKSLCIYSQLKTCMSSEVATMIEGVLRHSTKMSMDKSYVDTHGQSTIGFAFSNLLGFDFLPRIKGIHRQKLYTPYTKGKQTYRNIASVIASPIRWDIIKEQYEEIAKYTAALKKGTAETDILLRRFSKGNYTNPTYQALMELGKAVKTTFLCRYLADEELRIEINESLNIVERVNGIMGFLFYGKLGEVSTNNIEDQEITILALHLLQACLVYVNTLMIQEVIEDPNNNIELSAADKRALTPLIHKHINPYGIFALNMKERIPLKYKQGAIA